MLDALAIMLAAAGWQPEPLTLETASKLSPAALERRVFQAERGTTREVLTYNLQGNMYRAQQRAEFGIDFADTPRATALPGLCSVQIRSAIFGHGYAPRTGQGAPTHLIEVTEETRYALLLAKDGAAFDASASCASLGPVLRNTHYFTVKGNFLVPPGETDVIAAMEILEKLMRDAGDKHFMPVACTEDVFATLGGTWAPLCADTAQSIAALRWDTLTHLEICYCEGDRFRVSASFQRPVEPRQRDHVAELSAEVKAADGNPNPKDIGEILSLALRGGTVVD